ncbi:MAG TPA: Bax inhibitor-1/YccA family protein, partial [Actinomycetes bacterium]|nr:Bax inhibitor-1/YccA family protein [Actinomycetes bacterium]
MRSNNPVFSNSEAFSQGGGYATFEPTPGQLQEMYDRPAATPVQTRRMTVDDVIMKTGALFAVLLVGGAIGWYLVGDSTAFGVVFIAMLVGLGLGLFISFKQSTNPALILSYAAVEGVFVGGISRWFANVYDPGIVSQAVLGTLV